MRGPPVIQQLDLGTQDLVSRGTITLGVITDNATNLE
jgi:hypothetical protein